MTAHGALAVLVVGVLGVGGGLALYALVRAEHDRREETSREAAERIARQDYDTRGADDRARRDDGDRSSANDGPWSDSREYDP